MFPDFRVRSVFKSHRLVILLALLLAPEIVVAAPRRRPRPLAPPAENAKVPDNKPAEAAPVNRVPEVHRCVDELKTTAGKTLLGAILSQTVEQTRIAVSREWLKSAEPALFEQAVADELELRRTGYTELKSRLEDAIKTHAQDEQLLAILKNELTRAERVLGPPEKLAIPTEPKPGVVIPQFLVIELPQRKVASVRRAEPAVAKLAQWGWQENLAKVETLSSKDLEKQLTEHKAPWQDEDPDLSDRLPGGLPESAAAWKARLALYEYEYVQKFDLQGNDDVMLDATPGAARPDLTELLVPMLQSQLTGLNDLFGDVRKPLAPKPLEKGSGEKWIQLASSKARTQPAGTNGLRVTRFSVDPNAAQVAVVESFLVRNSQPEKNWIEAWSVRAEQDGSQPRADFEKQIKSDPQLGPALTIAGKFFGPDQLNSATRKAAAVMVAQKQADRKFLGIRDQLLRRMDGPPMPASADKRN